MLLPRARTSLLCCAAGSQNHRILDPGSRAHKQNWLGGASWVLAVLGSCRVWVSQHLPENPGDLSRAADPAEAPARNLHPPKQVLGMELDTLGHFGWHQSPIFKTPESHQVSQQSPFPAHPLPGAAGRGKDKAGQIKHASASLPGIP